MSEFDHPFAEHSRACITKALIFVLENAEDARSTEQFVEFVEYVNLFDEATRRLETGLVACSCSYEIAQSIREQVLREQREVKERAYNSIYSHELINAISYNEARILIQMVRDLASPRN